MRIKFLDLSPNYREKAGLVKKLRKLLNSGILILGSETKKLERTFQSKTYKKYAVAVSSGTDALYLACKLLNFDKGDEVITTPLSWIATSNAILLAGGTPVFVDIGDDLNLNPDKIQRAITKRTKAIVAVHFAGVPCRITEIKQIAERNHLVLIEDAAQAFGSFYNGRPIGSFGDISCFSLNAMKVLNSLGDAGVVCVNSKKWAEKLKIMRYNGTKNKKFCNVISGNHRIDELQAAFVNYRIKNIATKIKSRKKTIDFYKKNLQDTVLFQNTNEQSSIAFYTCQIFCNQRDKIMQFLKQKNIEAQIQHPILIPFQKAYSKYLIYTKDNLKNAKKYAKQILCIPCHEKLSTKNKKYLINNINKFYAKYKMD